MSNSGARLTAIAQGRVACATRVILDERPAFQLGMRRHRLADVDRGLLPDDELA